MKCILPLGVRGNVSQTPRPASGRIFLPLLDLDFVPTPGKMALADTQTWLSTCARPPLSPLVPCSQPQLRWLASISPPVPPPYPLHPPSPWLECQTSGQSEPAEASWSWGFSPRVNLNAQWTTRSQILKGNEGFMLSVELHVLMVFFKILFTELSKSWEVNK